MQRGTLDDLLAFVAVATSAASPAAAAKLGVSQSALSHTIRALEERLGRSPAHPHDPQRFADGSGRAAAADTSAHDLEEIEAELGALERACATSPPARSGSRPANMPPRQYSVPKLAKLLPNYPDIKVEIIIDYGLTDIVAERYDAGVRSGEQVAKDMIAVRIGPDIRMAVVGAKSYFERRPPPKTPQDLIGHNCINLRLPTHGGLYAWEFEKGGRELRVRVEGQLVFNRHLPGAQCRARRLRPRLSCRKIMVQAHIAKGRLKRVLEDWCPPYSGYHLYYPSRRQPSPAFALLVEALRYRQLNAEECRSMPFFKSLPPNAGPPAVLTKYPELYGPVGADERES